METLSLLVDARSALRDYVMVPRELWLRMLRASPAPSVTYLLETDFMRVYFFFLIENIRSAPCVRRTHQPGRNAQFDWYLQNHGAQGTWPEAAVELADPSWPLRFLPRLRDHELCQTERQLIIMAYGTLCSSHVYDFYTSTLWLRRLTLLSLLLLYQMAQISIANVVPITEREIDRAYLRESYFCLAHDMEPQVHRDHTLSYLYRLYVSSVNPTACQRNDFWNQILLKCSRRTAEQVSTMQLERVIIEAWRFLSALLAFHRSILRFDEIAQNWTRKWYQDLAFGFHNPGNIQILDPLFWQLLLENNTRRVHQYIFEEWYTMLNPEDTEDED